MLGYQESLTTFQDIYKRGYVVELYYSLGSHTVAKLTYPLVDKRAKLYYKKRSVGLSLNFEDQTATN